MRSVRFFAFLLAFLTLFPLLVAAEEPQRGDLNADGRVDAFDFQLLKAFVLGNYSANPDGDFNADGRIDAFDFQLLKAHVLGSYDLQKQRVLPRTDAERFALLSSLTGNGLYSDLHTANLTGKQKQALFELTTYLATTDYGVVCCDLALEHLLCYGCDRVFPTASTAKLPFVKYLCTLADAGEIALDETLCYKEASFSPGAGIVQESPFGTSYTLRTLMDYAIRHSDNTAYKMLVDRFGVKAYKQYLRELGSTYKPTVRGYGYFTAPQIAALLFDVAMYDGAHAPLLKDAGCHSSYDLQIPYALKGKTVLHKYGAMTVDPPDPDSGVEPTEVPGVTAYHDIAIVYGTHPYLLVILTSINTNDRDRDKPFRKIASLCDILFG